MQQTTTASHQQRRPRPQYLGPARFTATQLLNAEERAIEARKYAIQTFGYTWLKPAGVPKTLQGLCEERLERDEMEANQRAGMGGMGTGEWEEEMGEGDGEEAGVIAADNIMDVEPTGEDERDLDAEVPDADNDDDEDEDDEEDEADEEGMLDNTGIDLDAEIPVGEDSFIDPDQNLHTPEQDEFMMANERDLDDDVPQATPVDEGEWQHTDTELEDEDESGIMDITRGGEGSSIIVPGNAPMGASGFSPTTQTREGGFAGLMGVGAARSWLSGSPGTGLANTPDQQQMRRTSGPRGHGRENRGRESLD